MLSLGQCCQCPTQLEDNGVVICDPLEQLPAMTGGTSSTSQANLVPKAEDAQPSEYRIIIEKGDDADGLGLGLDVDLTDGPTLLVDAVQAGLVQRWNAANARHGMEVRKGDRIVEVNGVRGDSRQLVEQLNRDATMQMVIRRPEEFRVVVRKGGETKKLGLELSYCAGGATLLVQAVNDGLVQMWNEVHMEQQVKRGHRIVEVNGEQGDSKRLFDVLTGDHDLTIIVMDIFKAEDEASL